MILCNMALPVVGSPIDLRSMTGCLLGERYVLLRHCSFMPAAHIRDPPIRHEWVTGGRTACGTIARRFLTQLFLNGWTTYIRLCFPASLAYTRQPREPKPCLQGNMTGSRRSSDISMVSDRDLILTFDDKTCVRVFSTVLKRSAPYFRVLLDPNFKEGQSMISSTTSQPHRISLHEDDSGAMVALLALLHESERTGLEGLSTSLDLSECLLEFWAVADKYDCLDKVRSTLEAALAQCNQVPESLPDDIAILCNMAALARLLRRPEPFKDYTRELVRRQTTYYTSLLDTRGGKYLSLSALCKYTATTTLPAVEYQLRNLSDSLELQRTRARSCLTYVVRAPATRRCVVYRRCLRDCSAVCSQLMALVAELLEQPVWTSPLEHCSLARAFEVLPEYVPAEYELRWPCKHSQSHTFRPEEFEEAIEQVEDIACGLCLDCVEEEDMSGECFHVSPPPELTEEEKELSRKFEMVTHYFHWTSNAWR